MFCSSTFIVGIEAIWESGGRYLAYTDNQREYSGIDVFEWPQQIEDLGAGEVVIPSVSKKVMRQGLALIQSK